MRDYYEIKTPAAEFPVTTAEAKLWCKVETTADDDIIDALIAAATEQGQKYTNRIFVKTVFTGFFSVFETTCFELYPFITLRRAPLDSIVSVKYMIDDVLTDADTDNYQLKKKLTFSRILFLNAPNSDNIPYPLQVEFDAGYTNAAAVPKDIKTAIKEHINFLYENRGDVIADGKIGMPLEVEAIYSRYRILETFG